MDEIELLYFIDCPSWKVGLRNLEAALEIEHVPHQVRLIEITSPEQAQKERFLGSPSFRWKGVDLWPETRDRYDLSCRVYPTEQGLRGYPSVDMLRERLRVLLGSENRTGADR